MSRQQQDSVRGRAS